jgi:hypothetical protein
MRADRMSALEEPSLAPAASLPDMNMNIVSIARFAPGRRHAGLSLR